MNRLLKKYVPITKAAFQYLKARTLGRRIPLYVGFFITQKCNLNCIYCFPDSPNRKNETEFSTEEIFRIVDELYAMGTRYITILGGEPLIRKDFGLKFKVPAPTTKYNYVTARMALESPRIPDNASNQELQRNRPLRRLRK